MGAELRASFYSLLAQAFTSLDKGWAALGTEAAHSVFTEIKKVYPVSSFLKAVEAFEREANRLQQESVIKELALEYDRLFAGPRKLLVPPYESLYRYRDGQVMAPCAVQVRKLYRENGLEISSAFKDLPDHICLELQFMAYLCLMEAKAWERGNEIEAGQFVDKQDSFLREHLGLWVDSFAGRLASSTGNPFYLSLGKLVALFVKLDSDIVSLSLGRLKQLG